MRLCYIYLYDKAPVAVCKTSVFSSVVFFYFLLYLLTSFRWVLDAVLLVFLLLLISFFLSVNV